MHLKKLKLERLEPRRMFAVFSVTSLNDAGPGSLRQAIDEANLSAGADTIDLSAVSGTIQMTSDEYLITDLLSIEGPGSGLLTIDAQQQSRIFNFDNSSGDNSVAGITLVNGMTTGNEESGGAVFSRSFSELTISNCAIRGSTTTGTDARGGAVFSNRHLRLVDSLVENNHTIGNGAKGGGVVAWYGDLQLVRSVVSGNTTAGNDAEGGGIFSRLNVYALDSRVEGNQTYGYSADGGGIYAGYADLRSSTVSNNRTEGDHSRGGGVYARFEAIIADSTISANSTQGANSTGGGLYFDESLSLTDSTISNNHTEGQWATGGGINGSDLATIIGTTITDNETRAENAWGGGVRFTGEMTLVDSLVTNNRTLGDNSGGGGMRVDNIFTIQHSTISGNSTLGSESGGGGLRASGDISIQDSVVRNNSTSGYHGFGGGLLFLGETELIRSTVEGNAAYGTVSTGGGIHMIAPLTLTDSTVSGNHTSNHNSGGGGIVAFDSLVLQQSTISGNWTEGTNSIGGGIAVAAPLTLRQSTLAENYTNAINANGGGIWSDNQPLYLYGSIVAANNAFIGPDIALNGGALHADYSLIEQSSLPVIIGNNNLTGVTADLQPLANYGGDVETHALLPSSFAINAGDSNIVDPAPFDQRGFAFERIVDGRIDMGAVEAGAVSADFNGNGRVEGFDFLVWQRNFNGGTTHAEGDADVDKDVDDADLAIWEQQFGEVAPQPSVAAIKSKNKSPIYAAISVESEPLHSSVIAMAFFIQSTNEPAYSYREERDQLFNQLGSNDAVQDIAASHLEAPLPNRGVVHDLALESQTPNHPDGDYSERISTTSTYRSELLELVFERGNVWRSLAQYGLMFAIVLFSLPSTAIAAITSMVPTLPPDGHSRDLFGDDLSMAGETMIVGAPYHHHSGIARGAAYVYQFNEGEWQFQEELQSPIGEGISTFGDAVGLNSSTIVVGDPSANFRDSEQNLSGAGVAFVYQQTPSGWNDVTQLIVDDPLAYAGFGGSVAISNTTALIGAAGTGSAAYIFEENAGNWEQQAKLTPSVADGFGLSGGFGEKVLLQADIALVSAHSQDAGKMNSGAIFAFEKGVHGWHETEVLVPSDPVFRGKFGYDVDLSGDFAIMGRPAGGPAADGPFQGAAYIFERQSGHWVEVAKLEASDGFENDGFGASVAISGNMAAVTAQNFDQGRVYLFEKAGDDWQEIGQIQRYLPFSTDQFGGALSLDTGILAVGARLSAEPGVDSGAVYVAVIPEPSTGILLLIGILATLIRRDLAVL